MTGRASQLVNTGLDEVVAATMHRALEPREVR